MKHSCKNKFTRRKATLKLALVAAVLAGSSTALHAAEFTLGIQPILSPNETISSFKPLADYLNRVTGHTIKIKTSQNFFTYWKRSQRGDFDLMLDAAHFTGYRAKHMNYTVLAKVEDSVSYTLVTAADNLIFDPSELVGKSVATIGPPSLGAIRLEQMFPNPMREPLIRTVSNSKEAINQVLAGQSVAAMVPTPLVGQFEGLNTVQITASAPHIALSASTKVPARVQSMIQKALLEAADSEQGRKMLETISLTGFENSDESVYAPYARLLEEGRLSLHGTQPPSTEQDFMLTAVAMATP